MRNGYIEMVQNYQCKTVKSYSEDILSKCLATVKAGKLLMNIAQTKYDISYGTIYKKLKGLHTKKDGGQPALSKEFEETLVKVLDKLTYWKVRCLIQSYFNSVDQQSKQFKNNMLGSDRVKLLIKRQKMEKW